MTPPTIRSSLAAALLLWASPRVAVAAEPPGLKPGVFLYASPDLGDPNFAETVVLLVHHERQGSMGLIVNRPTDLPLSEVLAQPRELRALDLVLQWGGPVQPQGVMALVRSSKRLGDGVRVLPDVQLCGDLGQLKAVARDPEAKSRLRLYSGYAGWTAGQLAAEMRTGSWIIGPADADSVFTREPMALWRRVHRLMRRMEVRLEVGTAR